MSRNIHLLQTRRVSPIMMLGAIAASVAAGLNVAPAIAGTLIIRDGVTVRIDTPRFSSPTYIIRHDDDWRYDDNWSRTRIQSTRYCYPYYGVTPINERPTAGLVNCSSTLEDSTLVNPVIVDSTIIDSTLINPTIINSPRRSTRSIILR